MNYATIKTHDVANGPGVRVSLFVSGCTHHCKGCFNPETWDFQYGKAFDREVEDQIIAALAPSYIEGFSLLGGEPFEPENQPALAPFLKRVKEIYPQKTIWCYSGYRLDTHILAGKLGDPEITKQMLDCIDILVDGEFVESLKDLRLPFRGSSNQRIIDIKKTIESGNITLWKEARN